VLDKLFHGSPEQLVAQLVQDEKLSAQDLKRLHTLLSTSGKKSGGAKP
jgi:predicted transcriptional regulator